MNEVSSEHQSAAAIRVGQRSSRFPRTTNKVSRVSLGREKGQTDGTMTARFKSEQVRGGGSAKNFQLLRTTACLYICTLYRLCVEWLLQVAVDFEAVVARIGNHDVSV